MTLTPARRALLTAVACTLVCADPTSAAAAALARRAGPGATATARRSGSRKEHHHRRTTPHRPSEHLIFDEEFNGPAGQRPDGARWNFDLGGSGWGSGELQSDTSRAGNAELNGTGDLAITALEETYTGADRLTAPFTSARLQTLGKFEFRYGRMEARIQVPEGQGLVAQFWALGSEAYSARHAWPGCGEIDMMEVLGREPYAVVGHLHGPWPWQPNDGIGATDTNATPLSAGFHLYGARWEPDRVTLTLDGRAYATLTPADLPAGAAWPFRHPFFLLLDLAVGGEWAGDPGPLTVFPATMLVDWVRVWQ
jgi:beta-glucanase (GH16 family)